MIDSRLSNELDLAVLASTSVGLPVLPVALALTVLAAIVDSIELVNVATSGVNTFHVPSSLRYLV